MPGKNQVPRKLNMGSGKDWRAEYFNVDISSFWGPDAVLDFDKPLPFGQTLQTRRFGDLVLEKGSFDEIIANDVLEHIPNLMTAMTSCLELLSPGGEFRIAVPYDLSWGAWQDPTHVRAFNERSWLYYTDWFWYMSWTEARFEVVLLDLGLSAIGKKLKAQGMSSEEIVLHARAVDHMRVVLRKRLLTDAEKEQVSVYLTRQSEAYVPGPEDGDATMPLDFQVARSTEYSVATLRLQRWSRVRKVARFVRGGLRKALKGSR